MKYSPDLYAQARVVAPWLTPELADIYLDAYTGEEFNTPDLALAQVRASTEYQRIFAGNVRDDGSIRLDENDYLAYKEAFVADLSQYVNPAYFESMFPTLVENGVTYSEFRQRLDTITSRVLQAAPEIRKAYAEIRPDLADLSDSALIANALDPQLGDAILNKQITEAEIAGTAVQRGFDLPFDTIQQLAEQGLDITSSQELFNQARQVLPIFDVLSRRHFDPNDSFTIDEFLASNVFADEQERQRMQRLLAAESSLFGDTSQFAQTQTGALTGLTQR